MNSIHLNILCTSPLIYLRLSQDLLQHLTVLPTEFSIGVRYIFRRYLIYQRNHRRKCSVGESFIDNFLSVGKSVGNKKILLPTDLLTE
jgi:hypothetical protein